VISVLIVVAKASVEPFGEVRFAEAESTRRKLGHLRAVATINEPPKRGD